MTKPSAKNFCERLPACASKQKTFPRFLRDIQGQPACPLNNIISEKTFMQISDLIDTNQTIAAIATAPGIGGIAVIRVSGPNAYPIVNRLFRTMKNQPADSERQQPGTFQYGKIVDPSDGSVIDDVVVTYFRKPHSYTGEDTIEISCHGSSYIQQTILQLLIAHGARLADRGEFTRQAFLNGKMDLSQAEAIADLINAQTKTTHTIALNQMRGQITTKLSQLRDQLLKICSLLELELDFGDHDDLEFADRTELNELAHTIQNEIERLENSFTAGNAIKNGIPIAIIGQPNAGKSTLLNHLLGDNRAIVSPIPGTTRDTIEDTLNINGVTYRIIDTAGLRETTDQIENLGIQLAYQTIQKAQIVLWVIDSTNISDQIQWLADQIVPQIGDKQLVVVFNKIDKLTSITNTDNQTFFNIYGIKSVDDHTETIGFNNLIDQKAINSLNAHLTNINHNTIEISAKDDTCIAQLKELIYSVSQLPQITPSDTIITNMRHYEALNLAHQSIDRVIDGLAMQIPADLVAQDIRETLIHLADITGGKITPDEVLANIFAHFCIGK